MIFSDEELYQVRDSIMDQMQGTDDSELNRLFRNTVLACESKLAMICALNSNDPELGEKIRLMFLNGRTIKQVKLRGNTVLNDLIDMMDIATGTLDIEEDDVYSIAVIAEGTKSPYINVILKNDEDY